MAWWLWPIVVVWAVAVGWFGVELGDRMLRRFESRETRR